MRRFFNWHAIALMLIAATIQLLPVAASAAQFEELYAPELVGMGDACNDPESLECLGVCTVMVGINPGFFKVNKTYKIDVYKKKFDIPLFSWAGFYRFDEYPNRLFYLGGKMVLNYDGKTCTVESKKIAKEKYEGVVQKQEDDLLEEMKSKYTMKPAVANNPPFCCCKPSDKPNGVPSDCERHVDWRRRYNSEFVKGFNGNQKDPALRICGEGLKAYDVKDREEGGKIISDCDALMDFSKLPAPEKTAAEGEDEDAPGSLKDIQDQVAELNQMSRFNSYSNSSKLGAALIGWLISVPLAILGGVTLVLYIVAGVLWMTAAGNSERVEQAQRMVVWTSLGVVAILASYVLVGFVFQLLTGAS